jgi:predicted acetyltransferase
MRLIWPARRYLPSYVAALNLGWSADNVRGQDAAEEELRQIAQDAAGFVASLVDREARGSPIALVDGTEAQRLPGYWRWMWDGQFCGCIGFRWQPGTEVLPSHCLGHIGYGVVPWKRGHGYAAAALREVLPDAWAKGLRYVDLSTRPDNLASRRVIETNGGVVVDERVTPLELGGGFEVRYRIHAPKPRSNGGRG